VFVRVDFNVPLRDGKVGETHRIEATLPTLRRVSAQAKKTIVASHLGRPGGKRLTESSLAPVRDILSRLLATPVLLAPDCIGVEVEALVHDPRQPGVILLENLRFHRGEEDNDPDFAQALASLAEVYVNDAFGTAHRAHASTAGMVKFFREKGAGFLFKKEVDYLSRLLSAPERPLVALLGGAKVSDKIGVLRNLIPKVDGLLIGGALAYTFLKAKGISVGKSLVEEDHVPLAAELIAQAERLEVPLLLPVDHVTAQGVQGDQGPVIVEDSIPLDRMGLDIGPKTVIQFTQEVGKAKMVLWNGPLGMFEVERFSHGTRAVALALTRGNAISIIAGGDTVAAAHEAGVEERISHLSTGGGATLEFLEGKKLPGVAALEGPD